MPYPGILARQIIEHSNTALIIMLMMMMIKIMMIMMIMIMMIVSWR